MMLRLLLLLALIGITVGVSDWLRDLQEDLRRVPAAAAPRVPDFAFTDVLLTMMGVDGAPKYRIEAPRMVHFPLDDRSVLTSPDVWFFRDDGPPVELRAERARVTAMGERIWLPGAVDIERPPYGRRARLDVITRDVTVFPDPELARTGAPVRAISGAQRLEGVGMRLDLAAGTLHLRSRVRGRYVP
ncbi:MAG: LPS export ABC transporter periplasmic protein LptC [Gammaproteobacteria bacterium]|nr:LPS export ABC transporter periplasmic protein LptC [Gammaproteobacteria bacterium]MBA3731345.1 LPS export ABC transporter periplasmic protein LptC [Gammaproteobacteria bacterium]